MKTYYFKTPVLFIPFGIDKYNKSDITLYENHNIKNNDVDLNRHFIISLNNLVQEKYNRKRKHKLDFKDSFKKDTYYGDKLKLNYYNSSRLKIYDETKSLLDDYIIKPKSYANLFYLLLIFGLKIINGYYQEYNTN